MRSKTTQLGASNRVPEPKMRPRLHRVGGEYRLRSLLLVAGSLVVAAFPAQAAGRLRTLAPKVEEFVSDGERYVAWQTTTGGPVTAYDAETGRRWTAAAAGCGIGSPRFSLGEAASGMLLIGCGGQPQLIDLRTRETRSSAAAREKSRRGVARHR